MFKLFAAAAALSWHHCPSKKRETKTSSKHCTNAFSDRDQKSEIKIEVCLVEKGLYSTERAKGFVVFTGFMLCHQQRFWKRLWYPSSSEKWS